MMRATRTMNHRYWTTLFALAASSSACDPQAPSSRQADENGALMSLAGALQSEVAACASTRAGCEELAGDAGADDACRTQFEGCREAAKAAAKDGLDKTVQPCAEAFKTCRESAQTGEAKSACAETLQVCLGEADSDAAVPADKPRADASVAHVPMSPVVGCVDALHTCIEGDAPARDCTDSLRECIAMTVGHGENGDAGKPADAGKPERSDAGAPGAPGRDDAGKPEKPADGGDQGNPSSDASVPTDDAGASSDSKACRDAHAQCLLDGGERESCARALKDCRMD
jgi:hypothetical protein